MGLQLKKLLARKSLRSLISEHNNNVYSPPNPWLSLLTQLHHLASSCTLRLWISASNGSVTLNTSAMLTYRWS